MQAFLRLVIPKHILHVGELVPVQIKAYFRGGVQARINGLPTLSSDAFTLNSLDDKPAQTQENIDGQPYIILTWNTALSAVKAGDLFAESGAARALDRPRESRSAARPVR